VPSGPVVESKGARLDGPNLGTPKVVVKRSLAEGSAEGSVRGLIVGLIDIH
jgi:hypothetical protein